MGRSKRPDGGRWTGGVLGALSVVEMTVEGIYFQDKEPKNYHFKTVLVNCILSDWQGLRLQKSIIPLGLAFYPVVEYGKSNGSDEKLVKRKVEKKDHSIDKNVRIYSPPQLSEHNFWVWVFPMLAPPIKL